MILLLIITFFIFQVFANSPPFPVYGPCQQRCVKEFGEIQNRRSNIDTEFLYINVQNRTEFSLCKLGCSSPEYMELHLPAFRFGQIAYKTVLMNSAVTVPRPNPVKSVEILCLDKNPSNTTGNILLHLDQQTPALGNVYFVEIVARDVKTPDDQVIIFQDWCYSSMCNVTFQTAPDLEIRARLTTFDETSAVGGIVFSPWYFNHQQDNDVEMQLMSLDWLDDKASAKIQITQTNLLTIPKCSLQIEYKNELSAEFKTTHFHLDQTKHVLLKNLDFGHSYSAKLANKSVKFIVPKCREMVDDLTMCAPSPVSSINSVWNVSNPNGYALLISWTYITDDKNVSLSETNSKLSMSHFKLHLTPLITTNNEKCGKLESIRRDVTWSHRQVIFYVPDAECNYEVEIMAVDTKQRKSENKKIRISRINEPSTMYLFLAGDLSLSVGFFGILVVLITVIIFTMILGIQKRRKHPKEIQEEEYQPAEPQQLHTYIAPQDRLVYAYLDSRDTSKTIIGVRSLSNKSEGSCRLEPTRQLDSYISSHLPQHALHIYHNSEDDSYETIPDYRNHSSASDNSNSQPYYSHDIDQIETPNITLMDQYKTVKSRNLQDLQLTKTCDSEGNPAWKTINVVDVLRGGSFAMKYSKDNSSETQQAMQKEVDVLANLHFHPNFVKFEGFVTKNLGNDSNIVGILMENCRGGSLRQYIHMVGSLLRRQAMYTPSSESPPSSGYDSLKDQQKLSAADLSIDNSVANMSLRFCQFSEQIGSALEHLHRYGIIHTRVTTISIYLVKDFIHPLDVLCDQTVKLGDFGMSATNADDAIVDQTVMPPEVCIGKRYEAKGDIWQFGTCLVEMCSLGLTYQMQKEIPSSGIDEFDKLPSTKVLHDAAKKCLNHRNRPSASDLRAVFQTDTARDLRTLAIANLEKHNQSILV